MILLSYWMTVLIGGGMTIGDRYSYVMIRMKGKISHLLPATRQRVSYAIVIEINSRVLVCLQRCHMVFCSDLEVDV